MTGAGATERTLADCRAERAYGTMAVATSLAVATSPWSRLSSRWPPLPPAHVHACTLVRVGSSRAQGRVCRWADEGAVDNRLPPRKAGTGGRSTCSVCSEAVSMGALHGSPGAEVHGMIRSGVHVSG